MSASIQFSRSETALFRSVGREALLARVGEDGVDRLSETAAAVWRLLRVPRGLAELVAALANTYGEHPDAIMADVERVVGELCGRGWVVEVAAD